MEYIEEDGISYPKFEVSRTSKNVYRIKIHGVYKNVVVHSVREVIAFMDEKGVDEFEIHDDHKMRQEYRNNK